MTYRYAGCTEYCGASYHGWQRQKHSPSVQEEIEKAIKKVADDDIHIVTAGRTDTGVHGIGQVFHFDCANQRQPFQWIRGVNTYLPDDITISWMYPVSDKFHARFLALSRSYRYVILNRDVAPSYLHGRVTWHRPKLDLDLMQQAVSHLLGEHDFTGFRASGCQNKNPIKTVTSLEINQSGKWIWLDITANGFLQHMVRNIVGSLLVIGEGLQSPDWMRDILNSKDRTQGGMTAPSHGLYFVRVQYNPKFNLPEPPEVCRFW